MYNTEVNYQILSKKYSQTEKIIDVLKQKNDKLEASLALLQEENKKMKFKDFLNIFFFLKLTLFY